MKKTRKILIVLLIIILSFMLLNTVHAITTVNPDDYKPPEIENGGKLATIGNKIIGGIQLVGSITSVVVLVFIGIKYMLGSVEEKAEYKESMQPYLIGAVLLFATTTVLGIISAVFQ